MANLLSQSIFTNINSIEEYVELLTGTSLATTVSDEVYQRLRSLSTEFILKQSKIKNNPMFPAGVSHEAKLLQLEKYIQVITNRAIIFYNLNTTPIQDINYQGNEKLWFCSSNDEKQVVFQILNYLKKCNCNPELTEKLSLIRDAIMYDWFAILYNKANVDVAYEGIASNHGCDDSLPNEIYCSLLERVLQEHFADESSCTTYNMLYDAIITDIQCGNGVTYINEMWKRTASDAAEKDVVSHGVNTKYARKKKNMPATACASLNSIVDTSKDGELPESAYNNMYSSGSPEDMFINSNASFFKDICKFVYSSDKISDELTKLNKGSQSPITKDLICDIVSFAISADDVVPYTIRQRYGIGAAKLNKIKDIIAYVLGELYK